MMNRLFLTVCLTVAGTLIGFLIGRRLKLRKQYFDGLDGLLDGFSSSLSYSRDTVPELLGSYSSGSKLLDSQLKTCLEEIRGKKSEKIATGFLKKNEAAFAVGVLTSLGSFNAAAERNALESNRNKLKVFRQSADEKYAKLGKPCIKLGFLFGLLVSVLCW